MFGLPAALALTSGTNLVQTGANWYWSKKNYDYNKNLQNTLFGREDNSVQRRVADLKAAGLSPVLAAGAGADAGPVVSTKAPQLEGLGDLSNALQFMQSQAMEATIDKTKAENLVLDQQAKKVSSERYLTDLMANKQAMDMLFRQNMAVSLIRQAPPDGSVMRLVLVLGLLEMRQNRWRKR